VKFKTSISSVLVIACCSIADVSAQALLADINADNPPVPELAPGSARVRAALVDSGVNYLLPEIADGLARDRHGKLIAYDFWDMDDRPFDSHPLANGRIARHGTKTASLFMREAPNASLVAYRYPRPDMTRMRQLVEHAVAHDVRVIGLPLGSNLLDPWNEFATVVQEHPDILFIASAGNNGRDIDQEPVYPAALDLDNLLVVTSADDFVQPAEGVNWGRNSVDYLVPAEDRTVLEFDGSSGLASGSSYAVPRVLALAARLIETYPSYTSADILKWIRQRFADGTAPRQIGSGYLADPQMAISEEADIVSTRSYSPDAINSGMELTPVVSDAELDLPIEVIVLNKAFDDQRINALLDQTATILSQCHISLGTLSVLYAEVEAHQQDLATGPARTQAFGGTCT